jgi:hypothetical protein
MAALLGVQQNGLGTRLRKPGRADGSGCDFASLFARPGARECELDLRCATKLLAPDIWLSYWLCYVLDCRLVTGWEAGYVEVL